LPGGDREGRQTGHTDRGGSHTIPPALLPGGKEDPLEGRGGGRVDPDQIPFCRLISIKDDALVKSGHTGENRCPATFSGSRLSPGRRLDTGFRRYDVGGGFLTFYEFVKDRP
jgi:hypothetical protein